MCSIFIFAYNVEFKTMCPYCVCMSVHTYMSVHTHVHITEAPHFRKILVTKNSPTDTWLTAFKSWVLQVCPGL